MTTATKDKGLAGLLTGLDVRNIPAPPDRTIVLVPTAIADAARRLRDAGKPDEALKLLERNVWGRVN